MAKMLLWAFVAIGLCISGTRSKSVVNNVTVSSDVLIDVFFDGVQKYQNLFDVSNYDSKQYNTGKCVLSLRAMISQFPSLQVLPFFDSWGKFPSGILQGNFYDTGNFDQCIKTSVKLTTLTGLVSGQYCFASIPLLKQSALSIHSPKDSPVREDRALSVKLKIGICIPDSCSPELITQVFEASLGNILNGALKGTTVGACTDGKYPAYRTIDIIGVTFFSTFAALMIVSSIYDFLMTYFEKSPIPVLLAFSMLTNGKKLFAISTKKDPGQIDCLTGIRVFSMIWVVYAHTYSLVPIVPLINTIDILTWMKQAWSMHVLEATVSVDSFFFISGVLVAWLGFRELDRTNGKLNVIMMYVHRYLRLTPPVAATLLFMYSVKNFISTGPLIAVLSPLDPCDGTNWWPILLYVQNYVYQSRCFAQTWYLAIDFQLYILSPLILIPMWKWGKKFAPVLVVLALLSIGCVMATFFTEGYTDLMGLRNENDWGKTYIPTHTRYSPWLVGFGLGYFMHINRQRTFRLSKIVQLLGWTVSFITMVSIVFAPYFTISSTGTGTVFEAAMYESLKRVSWAIALAWITFACQFGFGGIVDTFLSHPFWQPLGRLTYSLFLTHLCVLGVNLGTMRTPYYFSNYNSILSFWGTFGVSITVCIGVTLAFESPVLVLEKLIFRKRKSAGPTAVPSDRVGEVPDKNV